MKSLILIVAVLAVSFAASGCMSSSCSTTNDATGQRVVCTTGNTFSYTRNGSMVSETKEYTWPTKASHATVSTAFNGASSGSATVTIKDADGKTIYSKSHGYTSGQDAADEPTSQGTPGSWTISVNLGALTGQVASNVRA